MSRIASTYSRPPHLAYQLLWQGVFRNSDLVENGCAPASGMKSGAVEMNPLNQQMTRMVLNEINTVPDDEVTSDSRRTAEPILVVPQYHEMTAKK